LLAAEPGLVSTLHGYLSIRPFYTITTQQSNALFAHPGGTSRRQGLRPNDASHRTDDPIRVRFRPKRKYCAEPLENMETETPRKGSARTPPDQIRDTLRRPKGRAPGTARVIEPVRFDEFAGNEFGQLKA